MLVIFFSALTLFLDRKASRLGGEERVCIAETVVCSDRTSVDSPRLSFAAEMLSAYLAQGYYGLSLALNEDFTSTFGLGHSSFLMSAFSGLFDATLYERSYMYKVSQAGWDDKAQWSTMLVWIASDVGFPLVPVFILILGFLWGGHGKVLLFCGVMRERWYLFCFLYQFFISRRIISWLKRLTPTSHLFFGWSYGLARRV